MNFVALKMLVGDRAKYWGLIFAISFSSMLMAHQISIFWGVLARTTSQIRDIKDAEIWVMDPRVRYFDEIEPLSDNDLYRVRGVEGVEWAVRLYKGTARAKSPQGELKSAILLGLDDTTLVGVPRRMLVGSAADLRQPDAIVIDEVEGQSATNPEELIGAAHAGCFTMGLAAQLSGAGIAPKRIHTGARVKLEKVGEAFSITKIELETEAEIPGIDEATFQKYALDAKQTCPISKALAGTLINLTARLL